MNSFSEIRTGDLLLVSDYSPLAPIGRFLTSSEYNHSTVAVRLDTSVLPEIKLSAGGELFIFEKIAFRSVLLKEIPDYSKANKILRLPLKAEYYTKDFEDKLTNFLNSTCKSIQYKNKEFKIQRKDKDYPVRSHPQIFDILCSEISFSLYYATLDLKDQQIPWVIAPSDFLNFNYLFDQTRLVHQGPNNTYSHLWLVSSLNSNSVHSNLFDY